MQQQLVSKKITDMVEDGIFINKVNLIDYYNGLYDAVVRYGGQIKYKLKLLNKCVDDNIKIIPEETMWLNNIVNNSGLHIMNNTTPEQQQEAQEILNKIEEQTKQIS